MNETVPDDAHPFDRATALEPLGDGLYEGRTSDAHWNFMGPFGGVTAATLLRSVMEHPKRAGTPLAVTINFCAPVVRGAFRIAAREVRANRSSQHWYMELSQADAGTTATGTAVFAERRARAGGISRRKCRRFPHRRSSCSCRLRA